MQKLAAALVGSACPGLATLILEGNRIGAEGARELSAALAGGACPSLTMLNLNDNNIGSAGALALAAALAACPSLKLQAVFFFLKKGKQSPNDARGR